MPHYPAIVEKSADGYGVFFPDLPGCVSAGDTVQSAVLNAEQALQAHIDLTAEYGDPIPPPSTLDGIRTDPDVVEAARVLIRADVPGKSVRVNITMPEDLLAAVDRYAAASGHSRSGLLALSVRERIGRPPTG